MSLPENYQFDVVAGDVATRNLRYEIDSHAVDVTDYELTWHFDVRGRLIIASTSNGKIVTDADGGIYLTLSEIDTNLWVGRGRHVLTITSPYVKTLLEGEVVML